MTLPNVNVNTGNGGLGSALQTDDGVVGILFGTQNGAPSGLAFNTPVQIYQLDDLEALGVTADSHPYIYRNTMQFFDEIGGSGRLNFLVFDGSAFTKSTILEDDAALDLLKYDREISLLGVAGVVEEPTVTGIDDDVYLALLKGNALAATSELANQPIRVVVEGSNFSGVTADLTDLTTMEFPHCQVFLGSSENDERADICLVLGRLAANSVQVQASRVRDGALNIVSGYNGSRLAEDFADGELSAIDAKGYNTLRVFPTKAGYFISNDLMATDMTDDYSLMARGRIMDKARKIAYDTYLEWLNAEIAVDTDGKIKAGVAKTMESEIKQAIDLAMTANDEISSVRASVDTEQNVLSTNKVEVYVYITPVGYAKEIDVYINFENPALS